MRIELSWWKGNEGKIVDPGLTKRLKYQMESRKEWCSIEAKLHLDVHS